MWTRSGREIHIPAEWRRALPRMHLDGEIFAGRGRFEATVAAVVRGQWEPSVCYIVFDAPRVRGTWPERLTSAAKRLRGSFAAAVPCEVVTDLEHAARLFRIIRLGGGEGLILRHPEHVYRVGRSEHVVKVKRCPITGELEWRERRRWRHAA